MITFLGVPLGSVAQVGTFGLVLLALVTAFVQLRKQDQSHAEALCETLGKQVKALQDRLLACETECRDETRRLNEEIWGMRKQNIAEQIAFINVILDSVDAPQLKTLRATLESVQMRLENDHVLRAKVGHVIQNEGGGAEDEHS